MEKAIIGIFEKIGEVFSTLGGWLVALLMAFSNFLGDERTAFVALGVTIVIDMIWGVAASIKQDKFVLSYLGRETFYKVAIYMSALCATLVVERGLNDDWFIVTKLLCTVASVCEIWSFSANILIVKPNFPFIRLFRKQLAGEISKKLNINVEEYISQQGKDHELL